MFGVYIATLKIFDLGQKKCLHRNITDITQLTITKVNVSNVTLMRLQIVVYITMKAASNFLVKNWMCYFCYFTLKFSTPKPKLIDI